MPIDVKKKFDKSKLPSRHVIEGPERAPHRFLLFFVLTLAVWTKVSAQEATLPRFYLDYAIVQHSLKADKGLFDELMDLAKMDRNSADFIAKFWWGKAKKECNEFVEKIARKYARRITPAMSKTDKEKLQKLVTEEANQCYYGVYYDHWEEVNQMIKAKYNAVSKKGGD